MTIIEFKKIRTIPTEKQDSRARSNSEALFFNQLKNLDRLGRINDLMLFPAIDLYGVTYYYPSCVFYDVINRKKRVIDLNKKTDLSELAKLKRSLFIKQYKIDIEEKL